MASKLQQSETLIIHRSEINLNPVNPKRHTDEKIKLQRKNLEKRGFLGGIVWNRTTGNLIDGHRRIQAMDLIYKYDGTPEADYTVKVEAVDYDEKTEKEQLTYMAVGNTKADINLIADYAADIDLSDVGLSDADLNAIMSFANIDVSTPEVEIETIIPISAAEKKENVKNIKEQTKVKAIEREQNENAFITLSFSTFEAKQAFCQIVGADVNDRFIKGETVLEMFE
jgi:hypothetical protein